MRASKLVLNSSLVMRATFPSRTSSATQRTFVTVPSVLGKSAITAPKGYNRWLVVPCSVGTHLSIGTLYAWSLFNEPLTRTLGVVVSSSHDWSMASVVPAFSTAICAAGLTAALSGTWADKYGPRAAVFGAGTCWGGGLALTALGTSIHSLPLVYTGFGVVGGIGIGLAYGPPVATLLRWFPDRRGLASGMAIMGFGAGAMLASPMIRYVSEQNFVAPKYLGTLEQIETVFENGKRMYLDPSIHELVEVVVATKQDIAKLGLSPDLASTLHEGLYVVGTGNTGASAALATLGTVTFATMMLAALAYRVPKEGWLPEGYHVPPPPSDKEDDDSNSKTNKDSSSLSLPHGVYVDVSTATKTPQFYQIWTALFLNATAGISVLGVAKTLMTDVFGSSMPTIVDASFAGGYVAALSAFNGLGRLGWASASDKFGRKSTYSAFFLLGIPLYLSIPITAHMVGADPSMIPLVAFVASTMTLVTVYGGGFSVAPAYLSDLFGNRDVGAIYGRLLTAWSAAGVVGPTMLAVLRGYSERGAIKELALKVDPLAFRSTFGGDLSSIDTLIDAKSVTISKLLAMPSMPAGTIDPSPFLYDTTMMSMSGLLGIGLLANLAMRPVDKKFHKVDDGKGSGGGDH